MDDELHANVLSSGRQFQTLNVIDTVTRNCMLMEADHSLPGPRVVRVPERLTERLGEPDVNRIDNGSEFATSAVAG